MICKLVFPLFCSPFSTISKDLISISTLQRSFGSGDLPPSLPRSPFLKESLQTDFCDCCFPNNKVPPNPRSGSPGGFCDKHDLSCTLWTLPAEDKYQTEKGVSLSVTSENKWPRRSLMRSDCTFQRMKVTYV